MAKPSKKYLDVADLIVRQKNGESLTAREKSLIAEYGDVRGPLPPIGHLKNSLHYWMIGRDFDGRQYGFPQVYAWQPGLRGWCLPNSQATGVKLDLTGYDILGEAQLPDPEDYYIKVRSVA